MSIDTVGGVSYLGHIFFFLGVRRMAANQDLDAEDEVEGQQQAPLAIGGMTLSDDPQAWTLWWAGEANGGGGWLLLLWLCCNLYFAVTA